MTITAKSIVAAFFILAALIFVIVVSMTVTRSQPAPQLPIPPTVTYVHYAPGVEILV